MTAIRSIKNQYLGINAHLHSQLQTEGGWAGFHSRNIVHLAETLTAQLYTRGYVAKLEQSLQIRRMQDTFEPIADVLIRDRHPYPPGHDSEYPSQAASALEIPTLELLSENELSDKPYQAVVIQPSRTSRGSMEPIVWIEFLSPTNKGSTADAEAYRTKRVNIMASGLVFIEIDYLHETPPTFYKLHNYATRKLRHNDAHPYRIVVIDPRPTLEGSKAKVTEFKVDQGIPRVEIPLRMGDSTLFDFNIPYQSAFQAGFLGEEVDYAQFPLNFNRYSPDDQTRIARRMLAVIEAAGEGIDLENAPFAVPEVSLEDATAQIEALAATRPD